MVKDEGIENFEDFQSFVKEFSEELPINTDYPGDTKVEKTLGKSPSEKGLSEDVDVQVQCQSVALNKDLELEITTSEGKVTADWAEVVIWNKANKMLNAAVLSPESPLTNKDKYYSLFLLQDGLSIE